MTEPNPDLWALTHMRWLALSRWDNEGGASEARPTASSASPLPRAGPRTWLDMSGTGLIELSFNPGPLEP